MKFLGNVVWFLFGGLISGLGWLLAGVIWCITVVGIPLGIQCFKFSSLSFAPFGKNVEFGGGPVSCLANIVWLLISGLPLAAVNAVFGLLWCVTIVGIPFGKQFFKIARLSLMPFGAKIIC